MFSQQTSAKITEVVMAKRKITLEQWCKENSREDLLKEWKHTILERK